MKVVMGLVNSAVYSLNTQKILPDSLEGNNPAIMAVPRLPKPVILPG
jgi:hypothetical protein